MIFPEIVGFVAYGNVTLVCLKALRDFERTPGFVMHYTILYTVFSILHCILYTL